MYNACRYIQQLSLFMQIQSTVHACMLYQHWVYDCMFASDMFGHCTQAVTSPGTHSTITLDPHIIAFNLVIQLQKGSLQQSGGRALNVSEMRLTEVIRNRCTILCFWFLFYTKAAQRSICDHVNSEFRNKW